MSFEDAIARRRSIYALNRDLPISEEELEAIVRRTVELVPDAYNMHSQRVLLVMGRRNAQLWDAIFEAFGGKLAREKADAFAAGAGTVLYYTDAEAIARAQLANLRYAEKFRLWSQHAMGMLQFAVWSALAERGVGASLQHYNPIVDDALKELFEVPDSWKLVAQMPFGGIAAALGRKPSEDVSRRFRTIR